MMTSESITTTGSLGVAAPPRPGARRVRPAGTGGSLMVFESPFAGGAGDRSARRRGWGHGRRRRARAAFATVRGAARAARRARRARRRRRPSRQPSRRTKGTGKVAPPNRRTYESPISSRSPHTLRSSSRTPSTDMAVRVAQSESPAAVTASSDVAVAAAVGPAPPALADGRVNRGECLGLGGAVLDEWPRGGVVILEHERLARAERAAAHRRAERPIARGRLRLRGARAARARARARGARGAAAKQADADARGLHAARGVGRRAAARRRRARTPCPPTGRRRRTTPGWFAATYANGPTRSRRQSAGRGTGPRATSASSAAAPRGRAGSRRACDRREAGRKRA